MPLHSLKAGRVPFVPALATLGKEKTNTILAWWSLYWSMLGTEALFSQFNSARVGLAVPKDQARVDGSLNCT